MCPLQLHLYDLVAVRKQQVGTAAPLKRTQPSCLMQAGAQLATPLSSPTKLIGTTMGKENVFTADQMDTKLMLPIHAGQAKPSGAKQLAGHSSGRHEIGPAGDLSNMWTERCGLIAVTYSAKAEHHRHHKTAESPWSVIRLASGNMIKAEHQCE